MRVRITEGEIRRIIRSRIARALLEQDTPGSTITVGTPGASPGVTYDPTLTRIGGLLGFGGEREQAAKDLLKDVGVLRMPATAAPTGPYGMKERQTAIEGIVAFLAEVGHPVEPETDRVSAVSRQVIGPRASQAIRDYLTKTYAEDALEQIWVPDPGNALGSWREFAKGNAESLSVEPLMGIDFRAGKYYPRVGPKITCTPDEKGLLRFLIMIELGKPLRQMHNETYERWKLGDSSWQEVATGWVDRIRGGTTIEDVGVIADQLLGIAKEDTGDDSCFKTRAILGRFAELNTTTYESGLFRVAADLALAVILAAATGAAGAIGAGALTGGARGVGSQAVGASLRTAAATAAGSAATPMSIRGALSAAARGGAEGVSAVSGQMGMGRGGAARLASKIASPTVAGYWGAVDLWAAAGLARGGGLLRLGLLAGAPAISYYSLYGLDRMLRTDPRFMADISTMSQPEELNELAAEIERTYLGINLGPLEGRDERVSDQVAAHIRDFVGLSGRPGPSDLSALIRNLTEDTRLIRAIITGVEGAERATVPERGMEPGEAAEPEGLQVGPELEGED